MVEVFARRKAYIYGQCFWYIWSKFLYILAYMVEVFVRRKAYMINVFGIYGGIFCKKKSIYGQCFWHIWSKFLYILAYMVEVFVRRKAYRVDAAETRFGRVLHSVKTIIFENFQIIKHLKFYPLQKRLMQCHI